MVSEPILTRLRCLVKRSDGRAFELDPSLLPILKLSSSTGHTLVEFVPLALLKNALDWASRPPNAWGDKAAAIVSVEGSGKCGQYHLRQIGVFLDLHFINKPEFFLNRVEPPSKFDDNGDLIDEAVSVDGHSQGYGLDLVWLEVYGYALEDSVM
ncbi:hypothetical protein Cgig2_026670 [Carnegiea gigantea]|uniref:NAD(P)H dehydrogenase (quinone) n=1 Tax=Carnegiea gigantea TaxID=171969 RepID=A0A9Q1JF93_9CARY|nr:hypothetical protein Cgig2_026670 [Carnegiea gigantea]